MFSEFLDALRGRRQERQAKQVSSYRDLVVKLSHDEKPPDPQRVEEILDGAGRSLDDLEADVRTESERRELAAVVQGEADAKAGLAAIREERQTAIAGFEAIEAEHRQTLERLETEERRAGAAIRRVEEARQRLREITPAVDEKIAELREQRREAIARHGEAQKSLDRARGNVTLAGQQLRRAEDTLRGHKGGAARPHPQVQGDVDRAAARLARDRAEVEEAEAAVEEAARLVDRLEEQIGELDQSRAEL